ncbi:MAG: alpha/beta hydrolase [Rhizobiaceae bacterium]
MNKGTDHSHERNELEIDSTLKHEWPDAETVLLAIKSAPPANRSSFGSASLDTGVNGKSDKLPNPGFVWLGGFKSDMIGTKAETMVEQAEKLNCGSLRFDYSGHGLSTGKFIEGAISRWVDESLAVFRAKTKGRQILVGSSMGGWIALRLAEELIKLGEVNRLAGLLLIAPAADFTAELMEPQFTEQQRQALETQGYFEEPSAYSDEPNVITKALIEDGRQNLVLNNDLSLGVPVRILQGMKDPDVPYHHALRLVESLPHDDVSISLIKDGDHRLSRDEDLELLKRTMKNLLDEINFSKA